MTSTVNKTQNYSLGSGFVFLAKFKAGGKVPSGFGYIGNTPALTVKIDSKMLDHYSSDRGIRQKDESVILEVNRTGGITTDNCDLDNIALFLLGSKETRAVALTPITGEAVADAEPGKLYLLGLAHWPTGARGLDATTVVVKKGATTYVAGTDYLVDAIQGTIEILIGGAIVKGDDLTVDYTVKASSTECVASGGTPFEGALLFKATTEQGDKIDYYLPWIKLTPNGEYDLKSDTKFTEMKFDLEVLKPENGEAFYADGQPVFS